MDSNGSPVPHDFQTKYHKLASEYSKLRAQIPVLKKAVLDEQAKTSELTNAVKDKALSLRKMEQEMESVNFRNQQLERRVSVLQDELDALQVKPKRGKSKAPEANTNTSTVHIFNEELQSKIAENARLHTLLQESERSYESRVNDLMSELEDTRRQLEIHEQKQGTNDEQAKVIIDKLQLDKVSLEYKAQKSAEELSQARGKVDNIQEEMSKMEETMKCQLETASSIIEQKLPFVDATDHSLNTLNIPTHDEKHQKKAREIILEVGGCVQDMASSLSNFHTYLEQRLQMYPESDPKKMSPVTKRFSACLHENAKILRAVERSYNTFQGSVESSVILSLETIDGIHDFSEQFSTYNAFLQKLLPYHVLHLQEESLLPSCGKLLEEKNNSFSQGLERFVSIFGKLASYVSILSSQTDDRSCQNATCCQRRFLKEISLTLIDLHASAKDLSKVYSSKSAIEQEMPNMADKICPTNACIVSSLVSLATATGKIAGIFKDNVDELCGSIGGKQRSKRVGGKCWESQMHPMVSGFKRRAANYLNLIDQDPSPSVPYEEALMNRDTLLNNTDNSESLSKQLSSTQDKVNKLEQAKEHWKLEFQLLQIKYEKKVKEVEEASQSGGTTPQTEASPATGHSRTGSTASGSSDGSAHGNHTHNALQQTNMLGRVEIPPPDLATHEQEVKAYFSRRINELVADLQMADSKGVSFHTECASLQRRLRVAKESQRDQLREVEALRSTLAKVQEELVTTTQNYESQLSMMSDHLATMNEKLTAQRDEIDHLNYQLGIKGGKKGKK